MKKNLSLFIIFTISIITLWSGCIDQSSKDNSKYVDLNVDLKTSEGISYTVLDTNLDKLKYNRYDETLYIRVGNVEDKVIDEKGRKVSVKVIDYEVNQPSKYVIKVSGHMKFDGDPTIKSIVSELNMDIRDSTGKRIVESSVYEFEIENHQVIAFTTQAIIKNE